MSIVSSTFSVGAPQANGHSYVIEYHTDHIGVVRTFEYGPVPAIDYAAHATSTAAALEVALAESEYEHTVSSTTVSLQHQTAAQFAARLRERYRTADRVELAKLAWWIVERINGGQLTDTQVRNAFGMTVTQYNTFKSSRLVPAHDAWATILASRGE